MASLIVILLLGLNSRDRSKKSSASGEMALNICLKGFLSRCPKDLMYCRARSSLMKSISRGVPMMLKMTDLNVIKRTAGHGLSEENRLSFCSSYLGSWEEIEGSKPCPGREVFSQ